MNYDFLNLLRVAGYPAVAENLEQAAADHPASDRRAGSRKDSCPASQTASQRDHTRNLEGVRHHIRSTARPPCSW